jgi:hypothetical protein
MRCSGVTGCGTYELYGTFDTFRREFNIRCCIGNFCDSCPAAYRCGRARFGVNSSSALRGPDASSSPPSATDGALSRKHSLHYYSVCCTRTSTPLRRLWLRRLLCAVTSSCRSTCCGCCCCERPAASPCRPFQLYNTTTQCMGWKA